jgi:hypothetical protein
VAPAAAGAMKKHVLLALTDDQHVDAVCLALLGHVQHLLLQFKYCDNTKET